MGAIHELILLEGKQDALKADVRREVVEAAAAYLSDENSGTGFLYTGWCQTALPHKKLLDDQDWQVTADNVTLIVEAGARPGPASAPIPIPVGVPYGARARLILLYLQSEALRTGSQNVELGRSMRSWLTRVGVPVGGKSVAMIRDQAERISRCRLTFHFAHGGDVALLNQNIVDAALFKTDEDGRGRFAQTARLSDGFFQQLKKHPVPLQELAIRAISNNSQALDVYAWLAYRLHALTRPTPITWAALKGQFGLGVGRMDHFRALFLASLQLALAVYPAARVDVGDTGITLRPSPPPVPPKQSARLRQGRLFS